MAISRVKQKFPFTIALVLAALLTAALSWENVLPASWVERGYSLPLFPTISHIAGFLADAVPFSWLDLEIVLSVLVVVVCIRRRNWRFPLAMIAAAYLIFFWGWGLNYHRLPLEARLGFDGMPSPNPEELTPLIMDTASELNRLWPIVQQEGQFQAEDVERLATVRVRRVIHLIDGGDWGAASRIKHSYLMDWWFRSGGVDGMFNPWAHEPILSGGIPTFEDPFVIAHELAHVHGIADEGEANFVAFLATIESDDPRFQYSGMFELWFHLPGSARLLEPGPLQDWTADLQRTSKQQIPQVTRIQSALIDKQLKANGVKTGIRSYSKIVALAIATRDRWKDFR